MRLAQLIYASRPFGFDGPTLDGILAASRRNNARDGITGALVCRSDVYVQLLEGPRPAVTAAFGRILRDDRHTEVLLTWTGDAIARLFPDWAMRDDPPRSWMWDRDAVRRGAVREAGSGVFRAMFDRLSRELPRGGAAAESG